MWLLCCGFFLTLPLHGVTSECPGVSYCTDGASFQSVCKCLGWEEEHDSLHEILTAVTSLTLSLVCKYITVEAQIRCFQHPTTFRVTSVIHKLCRCCDSSNC